ncbi:hypothetical protein B0H11DRAFT_324799 [Mycena galericulata]|nr:hypothetical protein B0H11DRAFT_324799 [Mycena galericulata]
MASSLSRTPANPMAMAISSAAIIAFTTPLHKLQIPGISDEVRNRLEWTWGIGHGHLDQHLGRFVDPNLDILDDSILVFPHSNVIRAIWHRTRFLGAGTRRPNIQKVYKGTKAFEYLVLPTDLASPLPARTVVSEIPPHLVLCVTYGKLMKIWGHLPGKDFANVRDSLIERCSSMMGSPGAEPALGTKDFTIMPNLHREWSMIDRVPPSFLSEDFDQTTVEEDESPDVKAIPPLAPEQDSNSDSDSSMDWEVGNSASCYHEPKRRLLPCELEQDFNSGPIDDEDDAISSDSHMTGVEDPDEFAKASMARGDYEQDRGWMKRMSIWVEGAKDACEEQMLLNDGQIAENPKEQPRVVTSLVLGKPDYLSKVVS